MYDGVGALLALALALVPGALYVWAYERQAGGKTIRFSDRVLRFVGGSALFHALLAPLTYWVWSELWPRARDGDPLPWTAWLLALAYVLVPIVTGAYVGARVQRGASWTALLTGPQPAPRAWDYLFHHRSDGWIRLRLKSGEWIGGAFADANGRRSYAASYPEPARPLPGGRGAGRPGDRRVRRERRRGHRAALRRAPRQLGGGGVS
jgi:hypothetical protein